MLHVIKNGTVAGATLVRWATAALALLAAAARLPAQPSEKTLERLFSQKSLFELQRVLAAAANDKSPYVLFLKGMVANSFNRLDESASYLRAFLQSPDAESSAPRLREALAALSDDYTKTFQYGKAAEVRDLVFPLLKAEMSARDLAAYRTVTNLYRTLSSYPPQTVTVLGDTQICGTRGEEVVAGFPGGEVSLIADTGSAMSLVSRSEADRLGLDLLDVTIKFDTATGDEVEARPSFVREMRIGRVLVRNCVFLVVPEKALYFPQIKQQRNGTIGFPVLAAMKELSFTREGCISVPAKPRLQGPPNFFLLGETLVLEVAHHGKKLPFMLDTGANLTQLYPHFFREFMDEVETHGKAGSEVIEGVGTSLAAPVYLVKGLKFTVAGREVKFADTLPVAPRPTDAPSNVFFGAFGLDLLAGFLTLTIDYSSMRLALE